MSARPNNAAAMESTHDEPRRGDPVAAAVAGSNAGRRTVRAIRDDFADPDRVLHDLLDQLEADHRIVAPSPRLRAWCRELQKAVEVLRS